MSGSLAETIRRAAALMRERANLATPGPWAWEATGDKDNSWALGLVQDEDGRSLTGEIDKGEGIVIDGICESIDGHLPDAAHLASWHPLVALAVADWLENEAHAAELMGDDARLINLPDKFAVAVARAYLGETAS